MNYDNIVNGLDLEQLDLLTRSIRKRREQIVWDKLQRGEMERPSQAVMDLHWLGGENRIQSIKDYRTQMREKGHRIGLMESKLVIDAIARMGPNLDKME